MALRTDHISSEPASGSGSCGKEPTAHRLMNQALALVEEANSIEKELDSALRRLVVDLPPSDTEGSPAPCVADEGAPFFAVMAYRLNDLGVALNLLRAGVKRLSGEV